MFVQQSCRPWFLAQSDANQFSFGPRRREIDADAAEDMPWTCQDRHGHGRGRRPIVVTGVLLPRTHQHAPSTPPPRSPPLRTTRRRQGNRTAAALTRLALADAPPKHCAAGTLPSAAPPPHGPVHRRGVTVVHLPVPPLPQRSATVATMPGRHLAAAFNHGHRAGTL